jgi:glycosyltransferase involved in cell wall biosynthesis
MKVALDLSSLSSSHQYRGLGFYTQRLLKALRLIAKNDPQFQLLEFRQSPPAQADLVHYPAFTPFFLSLPFWPRANLVVTVHDLIPLKYPKHFPPGLKARLVWQWQKLVLSQAQAIITDSQASKQDIVNLSPVRSDRVQVIYLAPDQLFRPLTDQKKLLSIKKKYGLPDKFVLYVGDLNWNKNIPFLAQTCLQLQYPLVVVGRQALNQSYNRKHPENQDLVSFQKLVKQNPRQILCLGFVPTAELVAIYNLAVCYAQPSRAEGFGLPVLEAMACGCPVITSQATSLAEISGSAACLINPHQPETLKQALRSFWQDPTLRKHYAQLGLTQARKFSWEKTARATLKAYQDVYEKTNQSEVA